MANGIDNNVIILTNIIPLTLQHLYICMYKCLLYQVFIIYYTLIKFKLDGEMLSKRPTYCPLKKIGRVASLFWDPQAPLISTTFLFQEKILQKSIIWYLTVITGPDEVAGSESICHTDMMIMNSLNHGIIKRKFENLKIWKMKNWKSEKVKIWKLKNWKISNCQI